MRPVARLMRRIGIEAVPHPTLRGIALLAAGVAAFAGAFIAGRREFVFIGVVLLALPLLAAVWLVLARVRLHVERAFTSGVVEAGAVTTVTVSAANAGQLPVPRAWALDLVPGVDGATPPVALPALRGRGERRSPAIAVLRYDLTPERRGIHEIGPLAVEEHDPFRLMGLRHVVGGTSRLVVTPRISDLEAEPGGQVAAEGESERVQRRADGGEDDLGTREYRPGDPLRRVHWRATARHGELMVRQEEQRSSPRSIVLLDTRAQGFPSQDDDEDDTDPDLAFERAVSFAASVTVHLRRGGYAVQLVETAGGADIHVHAPDSATDGDLMLHLAGIRPQAPDPDRDAVQETLADLRRSRRAIPVHAVLGRLDTAEAQRLAGFGVACRPAVAFLARSGVSGDHGDDEEEAVRILREAGWQTVVLDASVRPAEAWRAAHAEAMSR